MKNGQDAYASPPHLYAHQGNAYYDQVELRGVLQDDEGATRAMSKEQFFIRVRAIYNAGGTIWPVEVEFTHTTGEPPTLTERLNQLSKSGFIPANQTAVSPPQLNGSATEPPACPVHHKAMKVSKHPSRDGGTGW